MPMSDLARLVQTLYALRGYETEASPGGSVLRFRKGKEHLAVRVRDGKDPFPANLAHEVAETLPALGHAVLVCLGDLGHEARGILERGGIDVWTREKLIHEVGKAYLEAAERRALPLDAVAVPAVAAPAFPEPPAEVAVVEPVLDFPSSAPSYLPSPSFPPSLAVEQEPAAPLEPEPEPAPAMRIAVPPSAAPVPAPAPAAAPPAPEPTPSLWSRPAAPAPSRSAPPPPAAPLRQAPASPPPPPPVSAVHAIALSPTTVVAAPPPPAPAAAPLAAVEGTVLAAQLDRDGALRLGVGRLLKVDKATLELVPLHAFHYACRLEAKGAVPVPKEGFVVVDATTGQARDWADPTFGTVTSPSTKLQVLVTEDEAGTAAKRKVMDLHTQKLRVRNNLGRNSLIIEDRVVRPDPRTLQLEGLGLWWLPMWRLEGQNGSLRVNAATGTLEDERLKKAFTDAAEFL